MKVIFNIFILAMFAALIFQISASAKNEEPINWSSEESISAHIEIKNDAKNGEITYGPNFALSNKELSKNFSDIYLMRIVDLDGADHYTIFISARYNDTDWRSYNTAINAQGNKNLPLSVLSKTNISCSEQICQYEEKLAIPLNFLYFFDGSVSGLDITVKGKKNHQILIPASYFKAMLNSIQKE
ncbi:hypothetical protein OAS55_03340 [Porticoccus sp.]|nr:hypothetical protein [Porticoccus sp.]